MSLSLLLSTTADDDVCNVVAVVQTDRDLASNTNNNNNASQSERRLTEWLRALRGLQQRQTVWYATLSLCHRECMRCMCANVCVSVGNGTTFRDCHMWWLLPQLGCACRRLPTLTACAVVAFSDMSLLGLLCLCSVSLCLSHCLAVCLPVLCPTMSVSVPVWLCRRRHYHRHRHRHHHHR